MKVLAWLGITLVFYWVYGVLKADAAVWVGWPFVSYMAMLGCGFRFGGECRRWAEK